jgi:hypothetical protein
MVSFIFLFSMGYEIEKHDWPSFVRAIIMSVERYELPTERGVYHLSTVDEKPMR